MIERPKKATPAAGAANDSYSCDIRDAGVPERLFIAEVS